MSANFIRGGNAVEINLTEILRLSPKASWTRDEQEAFARAYEAKNGAVVRRPWETEAQHGERKTAFDLKPAAPSREWGMSPEIAERELRRLGRGIDPYNPDAKLAKEINKLEAFLGRTQTNFQEPRQKEDDSKRLQDALAKYKATPAWRVRLDIVKRATDERFLRMVAEVEERDDVREEAARRIGELKVS
jgi:hypothetical protein